MSGEPGAYDVYKPPRSDTMNDDRRKAATPTRAARGDGDARGPDDGLDFTADGDDGRLSDSKWRKLLKNSRFIGAGANAAVDEHGVVLPPKRRNAKELFRESAYKISRGGRG